MKEWTMIDGTKIKLKDMQTSHIENCIKMLKKQIKELEEIGTDFIDASGDTDMTWNLGCWDIGEDIKRKNNWIKTFKDELLKRSK